MDLRIIKIMLTFRYSRLKKKKEKEIKTEKIKKKNQKDF